MSPPQLLLLRAVLRAPPVAKAALVTSPGFARAYAVNLALLMGLLQLPVVQRAALGVAHVAQHRVRSLVESLALWSAIALLSSSCCAIQLVVNVLFSAGCLGVNSVLGPMRPTLLAMHTVAQSWAWVRAARAPNPHALAVTAVSSVVSGAITFMPEMLSMAAGRSRRPSTLDQDAIVEIGLRVPTAGCEACAAKIRSAVGSHALSTRVQGVDVLLDDAIAVVTMSAADSDVDPAADAAALAEAVTRAGLPCEPCE